MGIEVAVVGGGTIGNFYAFRGAKNGLSIKVFEKDLEIGIPQHCSGLISIDGLKRIGVWNKIVGEGLVLNRVRIARFVSINGVSKEIVLPEYKAAVIDRIGYDKLLANLAIDSGAELEVGANVVEIGDDGSFVVRKNGVKKVLRSEIIVDAEGAGRYLIRNFPGVSNRGNLVGLQMDVVAEKWVVDPESVELHFNVDDFFSWIIPISDEKPIYRVGVSTNLLKNRKSFLINFAKRKLGRRIKIIRTFGGLVVSGGPLRRFQWGKIIAVGDAAGHVKPTTGGGVVLGSLGASMAVVASKNYLDSDGSLNYYNYLYKKYLSKQFNAMKLIRRVLNGLGSNGFERVLKLVPRKFFENIRGDMDLQFTVILKSIFPFLKL